jgi:hypothetical protein
MNAAHRRASAWRAAAVLFLLFFTVSPALCQGSAAAAASGTALYRSIRAFDLAGGSVHVDNLALKRDRAEMTFSGTFYFSAPLNGRVTGAVFLGQGTFRAEVPPSRFERDNLRRLIGSDVVESDFKTAVLRFSDDTFDLVGKGAAPGQAPVDAAKLAGEFENRVLRETGANIASRLAVSLLNGETPGFFLAEFDKGKRGRFTCLLDFQTRVPVANFRINGGEKGLIFAYKDGYFASDVWMAFYALGDYTRGNVDYSDKFNLVDTTHYNLDVDLRDPAKLLGVDAHMDMTALAPGVRAIPMSLSEDLQEYHDMRLKQALRIKSAKLVGGGPIEFAQEDWEGGLTLFLPAALEKSQKLSVELHVEGDFLQDVPNTTGNHYPLSNTCWYQRHGFLGRSTFDLTFHHAKSLKVASVGDRVREVPSPDGKNEMLTEFKLDIPVALVTFALGPFERHAETTDPKNGPTVALEFYSMPISIVRIQDKFILAEMGNAVTYFSALFGQYPFGVFRAAVHPYGFGQGFPTMLMIPPADRADRNTFSFIAHETSHQWWGHMVLWRSYRDQWLSEGFAEYSGLLYTGKRDSLESEREMIQQLRESLRNPPMTALGGIGKGRLTDVGPLIMGLRLSTRETVNAYTTLIYNKGALVLRMLHFLFTDPATGNGQAFFDMMRDFVASNLNRSVSTEDFLAVANAHFAKTPIAQRSGMQDLSWFFRQWVYSTYLPSYRLEYRLEPQDDGSFIVRGTVFQDGVPEDEKWVMPLPVVFNLGGNKKGRTVVYAQGPQAPFAFKLPSKPDSVELDPDAWVLSEKTSTKLAKGK